MYRKLLLASVGAIALAGSAVAADLPSRAPPPVYVPPVPIFTWTGIYVGAQIGYAWGTNTVNVGDNFGRFAQFNYSGNGVIGGGHVGYNLQLSQFVIGLEGDVDGSSLRKSFSNTYFIPSVGVFTNVNYSANANIQGSIRGRVGYAFDRVLFYATGGVAFLGTNQTLSSVFGYNSASNTRVGWTVGGGLEYAVTNNWSLRAEYRYAQFGTSNLYATSWTAPVLGSLGAFVNRKITENRVQVGVSYKFDTAAPAPVVAKY